MHLGCQECNVERLPSCDYCIRSRCHYSATILPLSSTILPPFCRLYAACKIAVTVCYGHELSNEGIHRRGAGGAARPYPPTSTGAESSSTGRRGGETAQASRKRRERPTVIGVRPVRDCQDASRQLVCSRSQAKTSKYEVNKKPTHPRYNRGQQHDHRLRLAGVWGCGENTGR